MQMPDDRFYVEDLICNESFQRFCLGCGLDEHVMWQEWMDGLPYRRADIEEAKRLVIVLSGNQANRGVQLQELKSGLQQKDLLGQMVSLAETPVERKSIPLVIYAGAAVVFLISMLSLYFYITAGKKTIKDAGPISFASGKALRKTLVLNDGTVITMAGASSIRLKTGFDKFNRELWLSGEAFFDVNHDPKHPFIVHTAFNDIRVIGTAFNVKAYPGTQMETTLIRGIVRVESRSNPERYVILKPDQKFVESDAGMQKTTVSALPEETRWVRKRLDIDDLPLSAIVQKLQDWYGIELVIKDDQVKNYRYSGVFENETVVKTLEALQLSYPFSFEVKGDQIWINK